MGQPKLTPMESLLLSAVRTPIGKFGGSLAQLTAVELGTRAVKAALQRAGVEPAQVDLVIMGHARQAGNGPNPARQVAIASGVPEASPAWTLNQACASGLAAIEHAHKALRLGEAKIVVAGGMESMSRVPYMLEGARWGLCLGHGELVDGMYRDGLFCPMSGVVMGETAETLVDDYSISREEQDAFAASSQQKCQAAREAGKFKDEVLTLELKQRKATITMEADAHPRYNLTAQKLGRLSPVYNLECREGTITAANASGITDGASAMVMTTVEHARELGLTSLARYTGGVVVGCQPQRMGLGPVHAMRNSSSNGDWEWMTSTW